MTESNVRSAAELLLRHWRQSLRIRELPVDLRPADRKAGYAIQAMLADLSEQGIEGWKIAATSRAGQEHIAVDGPLAGLLFKDRVLKNGATVSLTGNSMRMAEAEFAFRMSRDLKRRSHAYETDEVLDAVKYLYPAIEVPDSRYEDFTKVGAPQLIADNACACWFVLGNPVGVDWRRIDLSQHRVRGYRNGQEASTGSGANVLGDPRTALTWIANELVQYGDGLMAGHLVTTGTCMAPIPIHPDDRVRMDFGSFGSVEAQFS